MMDPLRVVPKPAARARRRRALVCGDALMALGVGGVALRVLGVCGVALMALSVCGVALMALSACASGGSSQVARIGSPAPNWSEPTSTGSTLSLASLRGKAVYMNFFATWCPPCNAEAPQLEVLQKQYASKGLQIVGVDELETESKAAQFVKEHGLTYPAIVDPGTLRDQYNVNGLPVHVFIARNGIVQNIVVGELTPAQMRSHVDALLAH